MAMVPSRELRNHTNNILRRVTDGEEVTITANGLPVATLVAVRTGKRASMPAAEFIRNLRQADPGMRADLAALAGDSTDDLGPIR